jgi:hypothetical protein
MEEAEAARLRREILADLAPMLREELVADAWGRALVEVVRAPGGEPVVAGIDVEEVVGDEARVDAAFNATATRTLLPVLAKATEALCALEGVDLDDVRGGTFVHFGDAFIWLPGLVRTPSRSLDCERDALIASVRAKNEALVSRFRDADGVELDVEAGILRWVVGSGAGRAIGTARATPIGTFARAPRTWAWAWAHPNLSEAARKASASLTDALSDRDLWEITTPTFATDESTAWLLAALLCDRAHAQGVQRMAREDGALFVLVHDARAA